MSEASGPEGPLFTESFEDVLLLEHQAIHRRRDANYKYPNEPKVEVSPPTDLFGVALSGGGIRSASFCLGALQALDQYDLVKRIDYLSTVSGGGYTGASMIAAMTDWENKPKQNPDEVPYFPFSAGKDADVRDSEPISHIRDHSRYLTPKGFADFGVSVAIILRGLLVNVLLLLTLLLPISTFIILTNPTAAHLEHSILFDIATYVIPPAEQSGDWWEWTRYFLTDPLIISKFLAVLLGYWLVGWALWRSYAEDNNRRNDASVLEFNGVGARIGRLLIVGLLVTFVVELQPIIIVWLVGFLGRESSGGSWLAGFTAALGSVAAATAFFRERLVGWIQRALNSPTVGTRIQAWLAWASFYALGLALPLLIYGAFLVLTIWGIQLAGNCGKAAAVFGIRFPENCGELNYLHTPSMLTSTKTVWLLVLSIFFMMAVVAVSYVTSGANEKKARTAEKRKTEKTDGNLSTLSVAVLAIIFVVLSAYSTRPGSTSATIYTDPQWVVLVNYILLSAVVVFVGWCFSENANGLHRLYRDRLRVAFRFDKAGEKPLPLHELGEKCPYLLVNGTLNVRSPNESKRNGTATQPKGGKLQSPDPAKRGRNAEFFLFSKYFVGSSATGYAASKTLGGEQTELDLAACVAISGAAVSSSMGRISVGLLGPTLSLLNVRLGFWLKNPRNLKGLPETEAIRRKKGQENQAAGQNAEAAQNSTDAQTLKIADNGARADVVAEDPAKKHWMDRARLYLLAEAFGRLRSDSSRIYITDGGHIDNIGLYQLLKRRCKYIVVVDAEADPGMNFGAFCDVQRFARIDEGVRVSLDWQPVRAAAVARSANPTEQVPPDSERHNRHFAIGKIRYEDAGEEEEPGVLLYVKASVTGDEPDYVLDYERRYPRFPHESTGDQFFSEEQMEAYRALGFHAMRVALQEQKATKPAVKAPVISAIPVLLDLDDAAIAAASAGVKKSAIVLAPIVANKGDEEVDKQPPAATAEPPKEDPAALLKRFKRVLHARESIETPKRLSSAPRSEQSQPVEG